MDRLDDASIQTALRELPWQLDGDTLVRTIKRRDFADAIAFVNAVAAEAERRDHHPDICVRGYRTVELRLTSHDVGGITRRDLGMARAIEVLASD